MVVYFKGGSLNGKARDNVDKGTRSIKNRLVYGELEWYRRSGKKVMVTATKGPVSSARKIEEGVMARVFRYSNTMPGPSY